MLDYQVEYIHNQETLSALVARLNQTSVSALDIETINWWDRENERIALVQLAFREKTTAEFPHVAVIDALASLNLEALRQPLELSAATKAIHNASYDASRLSRHLGIRTSPIHDTMLAARRSGEKKCSLQAQAAAHLGLALDKTEQRSDWSRRPLADEQLRYAALDAACTLLLYEQQIARGLRGDYELREPVQQRQEQLPLVEATRLPSFSTTTVDSDFTIDSTTELNRLALAILGITTELSGRYSPEQLAVSIGMERVGLAGWIIDRLLGSDADVDKSAARQQIAVLCECRLLSLSLTRRLEATAEGKKLWQQTKE